MRPCLPGLDVSYGADRRGRDAGGEQRGNDDQLRRAQHNRLVVLDQQHVTALSAALSATRALLIIAQKGLVAHNVLPHRRVQP